MVGQYVLGALCRGTQAVTMTREPFMIPELPIPATALPTINILEDVAIPHNSDPSSNVTKNPRNTNCRTQSSLATHTERHSVRKHTLELRLAYILPLRGWQVALFVIY